ncbi:hypothetical protein LWI28_026515 [Acer negundo]|uniref:CCHC-type domain-containing protein n=1 Tax=Acer negundo TaxID=4023 RepID=A0AAD5NMC2_ACENE|nr:hypothetical protein LWI28_026515 [Acer negundo]
MAPTFGFHYSNCGEQGHWFADCKKGPQKRLFVESDEIMQEQDNDFESKPIYDNTEKKANARKYCNRLISSEGKRR